MNHEYGDCYYCGGEVIERNMQIDYRVGGKLYVLEDVPTGVCQQCGEQFFRAEIAKRMERAVADSPEDVPTISVPVIAIG